MNIQKKKSLGMFLLGLFAIGGLFFGASLVSAQIQQGGHQMSDGTVMSNDGMNAPMNVNANAMMGGSSGMNHMMGGKLDEKQQGQMHKQCMKMMDEDDVDDMHQNTGAKQ